MIDTTLILSRGILKLTASTLGNIVIFGCIISAILLIGELVWYHRKNRHGGDF